ncbi:MAG: hypothetical protein KAT43_06360 [Nanoarchaeota archaeon]|nr:hypothetical protein [Nanoarchaeota archaeon]
MALSALTGAIIIILISAVLFTFVNAFVIWLITYLIDAIFHLKACNLKKAFIVSIISVVINLIFVLLITMIGTASIAYILNLVNIIVAFVVAVALIYKFFYAGTMKNTGKELVISIGATIVIFAIILVIGILVGFLLGYIASSLGFGPVAALV